MKIQFNTDHNLEGSEAFGQMVETAVHSSLGRFEDRLTRVEVHLGDVNGDKDDGSADKRCMIEARPQGMKPVAVTDFADTPERALAGATKKMQRLLNSTFGRVDARDGHATIRQNESL